jgi:ADP-ribose pyrophosphatase YjhB (NUDIX family)
VHTKAQYPPGTYRLLTGGVKPREAVLRAALREAHEETGLGIEIARFAGVIGYTFRHLGTPRQMAFVSYVFVARADDSEPAVQDPDERITGFRYIPPADLHAIARELRDLPFGWNDWGHFRAPAHELVAELMAQEG